MEGGGTWWWQPEDHPGRPDRAWFTLSVSAQPWGLGISSRPEGTSLAQIEQEPYIFLTFPLRWLRTEKPPWGNVIQLSPLKYAQTHHTDEKTESYKGDSFPIWGVLCAPGTLWL